MFEINKGDLSPAIVDTIKIGGQVQDLTGASVKFRMRAELSSVLKVDAAATILSPATAGQVRYAWTGTDTDTAGDFLGWWRVTLPSTDPQDTEEFSIRVIEHAPLAIGLCTLADVREALKYEASYVELDELIRTKIEDASVLIVRYCWREFAPASTGITRRFRVYPYRRTREGRRYIDFGLTAPWDLRSATEVKLNPELGSSATLLVAGTDYMLEPEGGYPDGVYTKLMLNWTVPLSSDYVADWGYGLLDVKGDWGFVQPPRLVRDACVDAVTSWLRRDVPSFADASVADVMAPRGAGNLWLPASARRKLVPFIRWVVF